MYGIECDAVMTLPSQEVASLALGEKQRLLQCWWAFTMLDYIVHTLVYLLFIEKVNVSRQTMLIEHFLILHFLIFFITS